VRKRAQTKEPLAVNAPMAPTSLIYKRDGEGKNKNKYKKRKANPLRHLVEGGKNKKKGKIKKKIKKHNNALRHLVEGGKIKINKLKNNNNPLRHLVEGKKK